MGRRTLLLIISILVAAVGTALIALYVRGADARAQEGTEQVLVQVANKPIPRGARVDDLLASDAFGKRRVARGSLPDKAVGDATTLSGQVTKVAIVAGATLQEAMFGKTATGPDTVGISKNKVGASFELTDPQRVAGLLSPGMFVSIYYVPKQGPAVPAFEESVQVLQIGTQTLGSSDSPVSAAQQAVDPNADQVPRAILTFDLTQTQALKLLADKRDGDLALGLLGTQPAGAEG